MLRHSHTGYAARQSRAHGFQAINVPCATRLRDQSHLAADSVASGKSASGCRVSDKTSREGKV